LGITLTKPPGGTPIPMRTGKRRSANVIMSRGLPAIPHPAFVLKAHGRFFLSRQQIDDNCRAQTANRRPLAR
jgi:hypothetical protein